MKLALALEVVRFQRRQLGRRLTHCSEPMCDVCALLTIADELDWQWANKRGDETMRRPAASRAYCGCGQKLVDGICGNCNG